MFYEAAPETFDWIDGADGINNYPTLYGIRVRIQDSVIFFQDSIPTTTNYTMENFNFNNIPDFTVSEKTTFRFELLGYCLIGNGAKQAIGQRR